MQLPHIHLFPMEFWQETGADQRSRDLTPLYVERFVGPHTGRHMTSHNFWELIAVRAGHGELLTTHPFALTPGAVCLMPPGMAHIEHAIHPMEIIWVGLHGTRVETLHSEMPLLVHSEATVRCTLSLWESARKGYGRIGPELDGLALVMFARFRQALGIRDEEVAHRIDQAVSYLHTHFHEDISIPELAACCGYSEGHFYRAFKELTGKTPVQYVTALRVQQAQHWLTHSDLPLQRIARLTGFADPRYFSRVYKAATGQSPMSVRENAGKG